MDHRRRRQQGPGVWPGWRTPGRMGQQRERARPAGWPNRRRHRCGGARVRLRGGHYLTAWDGAETPSGPFTEVANVVLDGRGTVYVVDIGTPRVAVFELLP